MKWPTSLPSAAHNFSWGRSLPLCRPRWPILCQGNYGRPAHQHHHYLWITRGCYPCHPLHLQGSIPHVYIFNNCIGMEISGSVKNMIAITSSALDGLGFDDNACAAPEKWMSKNMLFSKYPIIIVGMGKKTQQPQNTHQRAIVRQKNASSQPTSRTRKANRLKSHMPTMSGKSKMRQGQDATISRDPYSSRHFNNTHREHVWAIWHQQWSFHCYHQD